MKAPLFACVFLVLAVGISAVAQGHPGGGKPAGGVPRGNLPSPSPSPGMSRPTFSTPTTFVSGKVVLDDGTELTEPVAIQTLCSGQTRTETYTDKHGNFSFEVGSSNPGLGAGISDASNSTMDGPSTARSQRDWRSCELQAVLAGFSSEVVELAGRITTLESSDLGRVALHRLEHVEGTSISVTTALAPGAARKAVEKGWEQEKKSKWDQAQKSFEKAVQIYPKYAVAWYDLGRAQLRKNDVAAAKKSFEQAVAADAKYVDPYRGLAELAARARQWLEVTQITSKLLALNPVNFPDAYLLNGVANCYLQNLEAAEKSARQGIKVDAAHQVPKLQYLLAMILLQKHDYSEASEHMQQYLALAKDPVEIAEAKKELAEIARLSANVNSPENEKK